MKKAYKQYIKVIGIIWGICFFVFVLMYFLVITGQANTKKQVISNLKQKKLEYNTAIKAASKETLLDKQTELDQLNSRISQFALGSEDSANLTFDVSRIAKEKQVTLISIEGNKSTSRNKKVENKNITEGKMALNCQSSFKDFAYLVNSLERNMPVIFIDSFAISRSKQDKSLNEADMSLSYFIKNDRDG